MTLLVAVAAVLVAAPVKPSKHLRPEQDPKLGGAANAFAKATVAFATPADREALKRDAIEVRLQIAHYALVGGAHAHLIFDNDPALEVDDLEEPIVLKDVPPGPHVLRAVLCRPWHEVVKAKGAFAMVRFWAGPRFAGRAADIAEKADWPDPKKPLLTYVLPIGERTKGAQGFESDSTDESESAPAKKAEPPALDFYLSNGKLGRRDSKIRLIIDKSEWPLVTKWEPKRLARLKPGEHHITVDLLNRKGEKVANAFNRTDRTFVTK